MYPFLTCTFNEYVPFRVIVKMNQVNICKLFKILSSAQVLHKCLLNKNITVEHQA